MRARATVRGGGSPQRRRRRVAFGVPRRDPRATGPERGGQDDYAQDAARARAAQRWHVRDTRRAGARPRRARAPRIPARAAVLSHAADGHRGAAALRPPERDVEAEVRDFGARAAREGGARRPRGVPALEVLARHAAAAGSGAGDARRSRRYRARRAGFRSGPRGTARRAQPDARVANAAARQCCSRRISSPRSRRSATR